MHKQFAYVHFFLYYCAIFDNIGVLWNFLHNK